MELCQHHAASNVAASIRESDVQNWLVESPMATTWEPAVALKMPLPQTMVFGPTLSDGKPCSHYMRKIPPLMQLIDAEANCYRKSTLEQNEVADAVLHRWISLRPGLTQRLEPPRIVAYPWFDTDNIPIKDMHNIGRWCYFKLKRWLPVPPEGVRVGSRIF